MGRYYHIICQNKACGYDFEAREGPGMFLFRRIREMEDDIRSGNRDASKEIIDLLKTGHEIDCVVTYLCPTCREWTTKRDPYILGKIHVSPFGTIRKYKVHYINEPPKCEKCGTELRFILNPRSSKNRCPKCGSNNMRIGSCGFYD